jgi:hypothetical protein
VKKVIRALCGESITLVRFAIHRCAEIIALGFDGFPGVATQERVTRRNVVLSYSGKTRPPLKQWPSLEVLAAFQSF